MKETLVHDHCYTDSNDHFLHAKLAIPISDHGAPRRRARAGILYSVRNTKTGEAITDTPPPRVGVGVPAHACTRLFIRAAGWLSY